jgi:hypothetical protein
MKRLGVRGVVLTDPEVEGEQGDMSSEVLSKPTIRQIYLVLSDPDNRNASILTHKETVCGEILSLGGRG